MNDHSLTKKTSKTRPEQHPRTNEIACIYVKGKKMMTCLKYAFYLEEYCTVFFFPISIYLTKYTINNRAALFTELKLMECVLILHHEG